MLSILLPRYCFFYFKIVRPILLIKLNYLNSFLLPHIFAITIGLRLRNLVSLQEFKLVKGLLLLERISSQSGIFINWKKSRSQVQISETGLWCFMRVNIRTQVLPFMDYFMFRIRPHVVARYLHFPILPNTWGNLSISFVDLSALADFSRNYFNWRETILFNILVAPRKGNMGVLYGKILLYPFPRHFGN